MADATVGRVPKHVEQQFCRYRQYWWSQSWNHNCCLFSVAIYRKTEMGASGYSGFSLAFRSTKRCDWQASGLACRVFKSTKSLIYSRTRLMTQISFYSLAKGNDDTRLQVACRLAEKAFSLGHKIFIQVEDPQQKRRLVNLLWHFKASSFVPHGINDDGSEPAEIGLSVGPSHQDVLINLSSKHCEQFEQFNRINEIVGPDQESLASGRQSYRYYHSQGFKPETHKI